MKKTVAALMLSVLALALSGCIFTAPEATLYRLPKLAGEYESLEARIDTLLAMGGGICRADIGQQPAKRADDRP